MQIIKKLKPISVNTDVTKHNLKETEAPFLRGYDVGLSNNTESNEGGNFGVGKKTRSNYQSVVLPMPPGINKTIGFYEAVELNEAYVVRWNSENNHNIYVIDGLTMQAKKVYQGPSLNFSLDPKYAVPEHRVILRVLYDLDENGQRQVKEKFLIFTDGNNWQRWINVVAAVATDGFNATLFPYYKLQPPHFDADELIDYIARPSMYSPLISEVAATADDLIQDNFLKGKSVQFATAITYTDNRNTVLSWYSEPYFQDELTCDLNDNLQPRCLDLELYVGSPHVEKVLLLVRFNSVSDADGLPANSDWALYDTLYKFSTDGSNDPGLIKGEYWKRTNPWANRNYNADKNTITYRYCGEKGTTPYSADDQVLVQNDVPLKSYAVTNAGDALLWCDNLYYYPNISDTILDKFKLSVIESPVNTNTCPVVTRKISVYAFIERSVVWNTGPGTQTFFGGITFHITSSGSLVFKPYLPSFTGGISSQSGSEQFSTIYDPAFSNGLGLTFGQKEGWIAYLAGTSYYAVGRQYKVNSGGEKFYVGPINSANAAEANSIAGNSYVMQFDFIVPAGKYVARIANQNAKVTDDYERTSTYVRGSIDRRLPNSTGLQDLTSDSKEIIIDVTNADYDSWNTDYKALYIDEPTAFFFDSEKWIEGYLQEDPVSDIGIEGLSYSPNAGSLRFGGITDHNGFYFAHAVNSAAKNAEVTFAAKLNCTPFRGEVFKTATNKSETGFYLDQNIYAKDFGFSFGSYIVITGKLVDCITGKGIAGMGVTMSNVRTNYTDTDGKFAIHCHTMTDAIRTEKIYFNSNGNCLFQNCDCGPIPTLDFVSSVVACQNTSERLYPTFADLQLKLITVKGRSLKGGGRYPVGIVAHDLGGRKWPVGDLNYVSVPTFLERGNFNPSQIKVELLGKLNLPRDIKWLSFVVGSNANTNKYLQWVGDKIEYLDIKGNVVPDGNGAVRARITIQSLLDFNVLENFATTANYQFVKNDRCRVYDDGQGNLFKPENNNGFLDFQILGTDFNETIPPELIQTSTTGGSTTTTTTKTVQDPRSFIIEYDERLLALKDKCGFWIELNRPKGILDNVPYFGVPNSTFPVIDGEINVNEIVLDAFDTYYQQRNINILNCSGANFTHPFESQSVSDFWGNGITSGGIPLFKNPIAEQLWYLDDVMKTDDFLNEGKINGLGFCRSENRRQFKQQSWGGIVAAHAERNLILFICENDWFMTDYQMNYAQIDPSGRILTDKNQDIGNPYQKVGDNFGCSFEDTSTIMFIEGLACWLDRKNTGFIVSNFKNAFDVSEMENKGYFINKIKAMISFNNSLPPGSLSDLFECICGFNQESRQLNVSFRKRKGLSDRPIDFTNNEREVIYGTDETFVYSIGLKKWVGWTPYVPEYYGKLTHARTGNELITFVNGDSWFHNSKGIKGCLNFYGVQTDQVITVVSNFDSSKKKLYQSAAIEAVGVKYFIDRIVTSEKNSFSYIPLAYWKKKAGVLYAKIMRNMTSYPDPSRPVESMLQDGKTMNGEYAEFRFVSDPNTANTYSEVNNILIRFIGQEKSEK